MRRSPIVLTVISIAALLAQPEQTTAGELTETEFRRLHRQLQPTSDEPWRTIPWQISLLEAQQIAAEQNKPIFIWAMDGHPLGCT